MSVPDYWPRARRELARRDPVMAAIMRRHRGLALTTRGDAFLTLARAIVGQQISVKAADAVWGRLVGAAGEISPACIAGLGLAELRACGLSARKAEYVADLAGHFLSGALDPGRWRELDDETLIAELTDVKGIGRWTAEMFLIFHLTRPDVFPVADLGLQKAASLHYNRGRALPPRRLVALGRNWSPWRSVATWYLWRSLDPVPVEY
jgi:DNA-3-methyladenine glycosylase II